MISTRAATGGQTKRLIILSSSLSSDLFTDEALIISCTLSNSNEILTHSFLDTGAIEIAFIDKTMACNVCKALKISFISLAKSKLLKRFDERLARPIIHAIYPTLTVQSQSKLLAPMLMTLLNQHPIILGKLWIQKHRVIFDISCDKLIF